MEYKHNFDNNDNEMMMVMMTIGKGGRGGVIYFKNFVLALNSLAQMGWQLAKRKVMGSIPGLGTCLGCGFGS